MSHIGNGAGSGRQASYAMMLMMMISCENKINV